MESVTRGYQKMNVIRVALRRKSKEWLYIPWSFNRFINYNAHLSIFTTMCINEIKNGK